MSNKRSPKELQGDIQRAVQILELFTDPSKGRDVKMLIPPGVLRDAHGIVFIRLYRIGFMLSAKSGTGIIIARLPDGSWSAPSGVSMSSLGFGHQAGGEVIDSIIVMNYRAAVKAFFDGGGQLQLGVGASLAAGPYGRAADVSASASNTSHIAATYAYSASKGLYMGYSFEGSKISERVNTNKAYYGRDITAREILTGGVPPTQDAARLYQMLTSMGAGPRPGLPFAPKSSLTPRPSNQPPSSSPATSYAPPPPPPGASNTSNNNRNQTQANQDFEEPPPPYQPYDTSKAKAAAGNDTSEFAATASNVPPPINDAKRPVYGSDQSQFSRQNINQAAINIHNTGSTGGVGPSSSSNYNNAGPSSSNNYNNAGPNSSGNNYNAGPSQLNNAGSSSGPSSSSFSAPPPPMNAPGSSTLALGPPPSSDMKKSPVMDEPRTGDLSVVVAKYDYTGDQPTDLSFQAGDHIIVTKRLEDRQSWWEGEIGNRRGFFPANYTDELTD